MKIIEVTNTLLEELFREGEEFRCRIKKGLPKNSRLLAVKMGSKDTTEFWFSEIEDVKRISIEVENI